MVIIGKYYLYVKARAGSKVQFNEFVSLVRDKMLLEKYIAIKSGEKDNYTQKWNVLENI